MSEYPLYDLLRQHPEPLSPMAHYLRDQGKPWEEVEVRRKEALREVFSNPDQHPLLILFSALEATIGSQHYLSGPLYAVRETDYFKEKEGTQTPEEKHLEYMQETEKLIAEKINQIEPKYLKNTKRVKRGLEFLTEELDRNTSLNVIRMLVQDLVVDPERLSREHDKGGLLDSIEKKSKLEARQNSTDPNDQYIKGDLFEILISRHIRKSNAQRETEDAYQTQETIEIRRLTEIVTILEEWKNGAHPLHVLDHILHVGLDGFNEGLTPLYNSAFHMLRLEQHSRNDRGRAHWKERQRELDLVRILQNKENTRLDARDEMRSLKPEVLSYRGPATHPEFAAQIDSYIDSLYNSEESPFSILRSIVEAFFQPVHDILEHSELDDWDTLEELDEYEFDGYGYKPKKQDLTTLSRIVFEIEKRRKIEQERLENSKPMGALRTESEEETRLPLKEIFAERANVTDAPQKLTNEIHIEASGSAMIKPYVTSTDGCDRQDESYDGAVSARITTYSVTFVPKDPSLQEALADRVRSALATLAKTEYGFEIPIDMDLFDEKYHRPQIADRLYITPNEEERFKNCDVTLLDGYVQVHTRLDLDDLWSLYYLLEDIIEPSEQIANAMDKARYVEERGMLEQKTQSRYGDEEDREYTNDIMPPLERMGSLEDVDPADYVLASIEQTMSLYALGEIDKEQLVQRAMELARHTLDGTMVDPVGALPTHQMLLAYSKEQGSELVSYQDSLTDRTRQIMAIMAGVADPSQPIGAALIGKTNQLSTALREQLRKDEYDKAVQYWKDQDLLYMKPLAPIDAKADIEKIIDKVNAKKPKEKDKESEDKRSLAHHANIALRSPDVGHTSNRSWRDTNYVSREKNSLWVRKDLPASLAEFVKKQDTRPDVQQVLLSFRNEPI